MSIANATGFSHSNSDLSLLTKPTPECAMTIRSAHTGEGAAVIAIDNNHLTMNDTARTLSGDHESRVTDTGTSVVVRTAQTSANDNGYFHNRAYTLDLANGQAVAIGFKAGQSANGGLGDEVENAPTLSHNPSALEPTVAIGIDQQGGKSSAATADDISPTMLSDSHGTPNAVAFAQNAGATMLKVRCGKDTYTKPDGSTGTAGKGPLASNESSFTLSTVHDRSLVLNHIVRRLTPLECERLQGFPDNWTKIPFRGKPEDECPDSPRYKALGNSWATNCAEWILRRIVAADRLGLIP